MTTEFRQTIGQFDQPRLGDAALHQLRARAEVEADSIAKGASTLIAALARIDSAVSWVYLGDPRPLLFQSAGPDIRVIAGMLTGSVAGRLPPVPPLVLLQTESGGAGLVALRNVPDAVVAPREGLIGYFDLSSAPFDNIARSPSIGVGDWRRALALTGAATALPSVAAALAQGLDQLDGFCEARVLYGQPIKAIPFVKFELADVRTQIGALDRLAAQIFTQPYDTWAGLVESSLPHLRTALRRIKRVQGARHYLREGEYAAIHRLCRDLRLYQQSCDVTNQFDAQFRFPSLGPPFSDRLETV